MYSYKNVLNIHENKQRGTREDTGKQLKWKKKNCILKYNYNKAKKKWTFEKVKFLNYYNHAMSSWLA